MWTFLLFACAGSVQIDGLDGFGAVQSAWWTELGTVDRMIFLDDGVSDVGTAYASASVSLSTRVGGCAAERAYVAEWGENSRVLAAALEDGQTAACAAVPDFLRAQAEAVARRDPEAARTVNLLSCGDIDEACALEEGAMAFGPDFDMASGTIRFGRAGSDPEAAAARWSVEDCAWSAPAPTYEDDFAMVDGAVTYSDRVDEARVNVSFEADLVDVDALADEDAAVRGSVRGEAVAEWCPIDVPDVLAL